MKNRKFESSVVDIRIKLMALWTVLMLIYIYADIFSLYRTGAIEEIAKGFMGPLRVSQGMLLSASALMLFPILIILVSIFVKAQIARWANIIGGILYTVVGVGNLIGEVWIYYWVYGIIEILITITIAIIAIKWKGENK